MLLLDLASHLSQGYDSVYVLHLATAGIALVVEDYVVGAVHFFFGGKLVAHPVLDGLAVDAVAQKKAPYALLSLKVDGYHRVELALELVFEDDGRLDDDIGYFAVEG